MTCCSLPLPYGFYGSFNSTGRLHVVSTRPPRTLKLGLLTQLSQAQPDAVLGIMESALMGTESGPAFDKPLEKRYDHTNCQSGRCRSE